MSDVQSKQLKLRFRNLANRFLRGRLITVYRLLGLQVTDEILGSRVTYEPNTDIGGALFYGGAFESDELAICRKYISPPSIVIDVGANIGLHSIYFSKLATEGCVLAIEPSLDTFDLLRRNVGTIPNIAPLNIAVSDVGGILTFFHAVDGAYSSLMDTKRAQISKTTKVPCMTIDEVVNSLRLDRVDFIKIDVEGFEYNALKGMANIISRFNPVIFCEIYKGTDSNQAPDETVRFLLDRNYSAFVMREGRIFEYQRHDDSSYNYLFVPRQQPNP